MRFGALPELKNVKKDLADSSFLGSMHGRPGRGSHLSWPGVLPGRRMHAVRGKEHAKWVHAAPFKALRFHRIEL